MGILGDRNSASLLTQIMQSGEAVKRRMKDFPGQMRYQLEEPLPQGELHPEQDIVKVKQDIKQKFTDVAADLAAPGSGKLAGLIGSFYGPKSKLFGQRALESAKKVKDFVLKTRTAQLGTAQTKVSTQDMNSIMEHTGRFQLPWDQKTWWGLAPGMLADVKPTSAKVLSAAAKKGGVTAPLAELLQADNLFRHYPHFADMPLMLQKGKGSGYFQGDVGGHGAISVTGNTLDELLDIFAHETIHGIQKFEDAIGVGINAEYIAKHMPDKVLPGMEALGYNKDKVLEAVSNYRQKKAVPQDLREKILEVAHKQYLNEGGEVQARMAQEVRSKQLYDNLLGKLTEKLTVPETFEDLMLMRAVDIAAPVRDVTKVWTMPK